MERALHLAARKGLAAISFGRLGEHASEIKMLFFLCRLFPNNRKLQFFLKWDFESFRSESSSSTEDEGEWHRRLFYFANLFAISNLQFVHFLLLKMSFEENFILQKSSCYACLER